MKGFSGATPIIVMARKDFSALQGMVKDTMHFSDEIFGFHAEQAVEKAQSLDRRVRRNLSIYPRHKPFAERVYKIGWEW
jgi:hypothetical protein